MSETSPTDNRPGVRDVGSTGRRYRYAGVCGISAVAYAVAVLATSAPTALLLGLFVPLSFGTELLLQARRPFRANPGSRDRSGLGGESESVGG